DAATARILAARLRFGALATPVKEIRFMGPRRSSTIEAKKDGCELRRAAFNSGQTDPLLLEVRRKVVELEGVNWPLEGDEDKERQLPEFSLVPLAKSRAFESAAEWFHAREKKE
ncbi:unnamed protein product, partial [Polarella glacialis]